ncbi:MAG: bifunctional UDP-sugar hydrolase/5'-nucleotidase UshA [Aquabacterium sp.]
MQRRHLFALAVTAVAALAAGCAAPPPAAPRAPIALTVLHTNDHHGRFWTNRDGEYGLAARKTLVDRIRAEVAAAGGHVLLLDGGDINTGIPESDLQDAEPDIRGMNAIGYDAVAVGNHEFDKPREVLDKQRRWATFPQLAANIVRRADGRTLFEPYRILERGGWRIAVMGLTTEDTRKMVLPGNIADLDFVRPAQAAAALMPRLRQQADVVMAVTHMGHFTDGRSGVNAPGDVEMAREVKGFDLIVGGHSQNPVCMQGDNRRNDAHVPGQPCAPDRQNGAWIVQAYEWGKYVGRADFTLGPQGLQLQRYQLLPVNLKLPGPDGKPRFAAEEIAQDPALLALLKPFQEAGQARLNVPVGSSEVKFDGERGSVRLRPTNLGQLVGRSMMDKTAADIAVLNAGGLRDSLPAGPVSYRDVLKVLPFGNTIGLVEMTGEQLQAYLDVASRMAPNAGAFAHVVGATMTFQGGRALDVRIGGQPLQPQRRYKLTINNFVAVGGDGYPPVRDLPGYVDTGFVDADVLRSYITRLSPLKAAPYEPGDAVRRVN